MSVRVLIVDDQALVRAGFRTILDSEPGIEVVGEAADGAAAVAVVETLRPDVVCMDVQMPGMDGLEATRRIVSAHAGEGRPSVLVLTTFNREDYLFQALDAGASGFLLKNSTPEQLIEAVQVLARGDALLSPDVTRAVIAAAARRDADRGGGGVRSDSTVPPERAPSARRDGPSEASAPRSAADAGHRGTAAEAEGFEPPVVSPTLAFKASAFGRSATLP